MVAGPTRDQSSRVVGKAPNVRKERAADEVGPQVGRHMRHTCGSLFFFCGSGGSTTCIVVVGCECRREASGRAGIIEGDSGGATASIAGVSWFTFSFERRRRRVEGLRGSRRAQTRRKSEWRAPPPLTMNPMLIPITPLIIIHIIVAEAVRGVDADGARVAVHRSVWVVKDCAVQPFAHNRNRGLEEREEVS